MTNLIDFDTIFASYLSDWYKRKKAEGVSPAGLEEAAGGVYAEWAALPLKETGGVSAREYFDCIKDPKELITLLIKYSAADMSAPDALAERIASSSDCTKYLLDVARLAENEELALFAVDVLSAQNNPGLKNLLIEWLISGKGGEYAEAAVERLTETADEAAPLLLKILDDNENKLKIENGKLKSKDDCHCEERSDEAIQAITINAVKTDGKIPLLRGVREADGVENLKKPLSDEAVKNIADILVYVKHKDDRILKLLLRLFKEEEDDAPLYASYLGKYGDERALPALLEYGSRPDINYLQFVESRNAVEALGGELDNRKDFKGDKYYKLLKEQPAD